MSLSYVKSKSYYESIHIEWAGIGYDKEKLVKLIKRIHKYSPEFKTVKNDVSRTGETVITMHLVNPKTREVLGEGHGSNPKKAEQNASKNALIKLGYFKN